MLLFDGSNLCHRALEAVNRDYGRYDYKLALPYCFSIIGSTANWHHLQEAIIVGFDIGVPLFRRELLSEYKSRKNPVGITPDYLLSKMNKNKELLEDDSRKSFDQHYNKLTTILNELILPLLGCVSIKLQNCEADDIIAYAVKRIGSEEPAYIISSDRDYLQLVCDTVTVYDPKIKTTFDIDQLDHMGYDTSNLKEHFLWTKAIMGDNSDDIDGISGIGTKTAIPYAKQLLENNLNFSNIERVKGGSKKAFELLLEDKEKIIRNYNLMNMDYPYQKNLPILDHIRKGYLKHLNVPPNYTKVIESLSILGISSYNDIKNINDILDSNINSNIKELINELT